MPAVEASQACLTERVLVQASSLLLAPILACTHTLAPPLPHYALKHTRTYKQIRFMSDSLPLRVVAGSPAAARVELEACSFLTSATLAEYLHHMVWVMLNQFLQLFVCVDNRAKLERSIGEEIWSRAALMTGPYEFGGLISRCIRTASPTQRKKSGSGFGLFKSFVSRTCSSVYSRSSDLNGYHTRWYGLQSRLILFATSYELYEYDVHERKLNQD